MLHSPHTLDHCIMCGLMVRCSFCDTNCCSGAENCEQCASAHEAQNQMYAGELVCFTTITATYAGIQKRLTEDIEHLPGLVGAETPGWVKSQTQELIGDAVWSWQLLYTALALSQL
jgi:hypothetical protein